MEYLLHAFGAKMRFAKVKAASAAKKKLLAHVGTVVRAVFDQQDVQGRSSHKGLRLSGWQHNAAQPIAKNLLQQLQVQGMFHGLDMVSIGTARVTQLKITRVG